jgi:mRNA-degrading endonuclease RelE of RelBE toxin-antitoxin system
MLKKIPKRFARTLKEKLKKSKTKLINKRFIAYKLAFEIDNTLKLR